MNVACSIRTMRAERGLSLEELAFRAEILPHLLEAFESGEAVPNYVVLQRLAEALDTPVALLAGDGWGACRTCLFWAATAPDSFGAHACMMIRHSRETEKAEDKAWVEDSENYVALLYTKPDFGCHLWRARSGDEEEEPDPCVA